MKILVTGTAGFIGSAVAKRLLERGDDVVGIDNLNDYYDVSLKQARLNRLLSFDRFTDLRRDLVDRDGIEAIFEEFEPERVIHLAAQAGVRYSIENPHAYVDSNVVGFMNILQGCRERKVGHLVYASTSSVYGANRTMPFSVHHNVDHPLSLYAATKKANELMAHTYSHLFGLPTSGLRFFTVYGPWGRPDMALFKFTKAIIEGKPIQVYNHGHPQTRFYLYRRHRRRRDQGCRQGGRAQSRVVPARSLISATSFAPYRLLQHRQRPTRRLGALYRGSRGLPRHESRTRAFADAAWRCAGDQRRYRRP